MHWRVILEKLFIPNIQHISGVDNIVADTISRLPFMPSNKNETYTIKAQCHANELFTIFREENNDN